MRRLSRLVMLSATLLAPLLAVACGDDDEGDNPGGGATGNEAGEGGTTNGGTKNNGGSAGSKAGGGSGGSDAGAANGGAAGSDPGPSCNIDALAEPEAIPVDENGDIAEDLTLESGKSYTFDAAMRVLEGVTLTIEPCVKVMGTAPTAVLGVLPGAKIEAAGLPDAPIVFTSSKAPGQRLPGDWGGIIILGNAQVNQTTPTIEGLVEATGYGSADDASNDESSGTLQYVRIEFVGRDIDGEGNESNGLTFGGVGSGTVVDHVMVSNSIDDCFEWFGGTVSASHLIAMNCDDDMFDADFGFSGSVQYVFGRQFESTTETDSNGFEMDTANNANITPRTTAQWSNVTLCGANTGEAPAENPRIGMVLRRQLSGSITNAIVTGFDSGAFSVRNTTATPPTDVALTSSLIFGNLSTYHATHDGPADWFEAETSNEIAEEAPAGFDCYSNPPAPIPDEDVAGVDPGGDFEAAEYKGAFKAGENWLDAAWVDWSEE